MSAAGTLRVAVDMRRIADGDQAGITRFTTGIVGALAERPGIEVHLVAHRPLPADLGIPVHRIGGRREVDREQIRLPAALARLEPDVLLSPANRGLPLFSPCPMVLVLYDTAEWNRSLVPPPAGAAAARFAYSNAVSLSRAVRIVTTSEHSAGAIRRRLGIDEERIRVVQGGVERRFFDDPGPAAVTGARQRYGVLEGSVLCVGSLHPRKDLPTLVRAVAALPSQVAPRVVLAGVGPETDRLRALAGAVGAPERLHLAGFVRDEDLPALYRAAGCVVLAGSGEGFGLPALEAMAAGAPVLAARAGALPEVVARAGRLFPAGDAPALSRELAVVLGSAEERSRMGTAGRQHADHFTWERAAHQMEAVLREATALGRGSRLRTQLRSLRSLPRWLR